MAQDDNELSQCSAAGEINDNSQGKRVSQDILNPFLAPAGWQLSRQEWFFFRCVFKAQRCSANVHICIISARAAFDTFRGCLVMQTFSPVMRRRSSTHVLRPSLRRPTP